MAEPIGKYAKIEKEVMGLLKIRELKEALTFFEEAYKHSQRKEKDEIYLEITNLRENLDFKSDEHFASLEKIMREENPSLFHN